MSFSIRRVNVCEHTVKTAPSDSFENVFIWQRLYHVFTYIYSLMIEKDIFDRQNVSVKLPCVYVCLSSEDLFIFW